MDLSLIILNYRTKNLLKECLRSLRLAHPALAMEIIVVDNASGDGSAEMVLAEFPEVRLIRSATNAGYAAGNNLGLKVAVGRYVMIINPDILVWPTSLETLVHFMDEHPDVGIVGPQLTNPDGSIQQSCYRFQTPMIPVYRRTILGKLPSGKRAMREYLMEDFNHASTRDVDWLLGGALLVRRQAIEQVGLLDEAFFLYCEDTDWCRRFWEKGWRVVYHPASKMVHFHKRASRGGVMQLFKNKITRTHVRSGVIYFKKYWKKTDPHHAYSLTAAQTSSSTLPDPK